MNENDSGLNLSTDALWVPRYRTIALIGISVILLTIVLASGWSSLPSRLWYPSALVGSMVLGLMVAYRLRSSPPVFARPERGVSVRHFLASQFVLSVAVFLIILCLCRDLRTSEISTIAWSVCVSMLFLGGVLSVTKARGAIVIAEAVFMIFVFMIPAIANHSAYHGRGDLFFHVEIVDRLLSTGHISSSGYETWPGWHIGVALCSSISGIDSSISVFVFVGVSLAIAVPFIGSFTRRLTKSSELLAIAPVLLLISPEFMTWLLYLTPTALCFGLFSILVWSISRGQNVRAGSIFLIVSVMTVVSHSLSPLIITCILFLGCLSAGRRSSDRTGREIDWRLARPAILGTLLFSYWFLSGTSFYAPFVAGLDVAFDRAVVFSAGASHGSAAYSVLTNFSLVVVVFIVTTCLALAYVGDRRILGMSLRDFRVFSLLAMFATASLLFDLLPLEVFRTVALTRWALFAWFFVAVIGALLLMSLWHRRPRRYVAGILLSLVFLVALSVAAASSFDTLPFRTDKFGAAPRPYLLESEEGLAQFAVLYYSGNLSSDAILGYYLEVLGHAENLKIDPTVDGLHSESNAWIVRQAELRGRGLVYFNGSGDHYASYSEVQQLVGVMGIDCLADTGTSNFLMASDAS